MFQRDVDVLNKVGQTLHGWGWQKALARDLGVSARVMRKWAAGQAHVPSRHWPVMYRLLMQRSQDCKQVGKELMGQTK